MTLTHKLDSRYNLFSVKDVDLAIRQPKSSIAVGPDGLTAVHFKNLGQQCLRYLTELFNLSIRHANIPVIWKEAVIVPILKPGKSADLSSSYRPKSLLSPAVKFLERLLKPEINESLPKNSNQHAYAKLHSTVTALLPIATRIAIGFNDEKPARRSALAMIDISKTFGSVDHLLLIEQICNSNLRSNYVRCIAAYLRGRTARCQYNGVVSKLLQIYSGTPQGSVLSYFVSDSPREADIEQHYADDLDLLESDPQLVILSEKLDSSVQATSKVGKVEKSEAGP
jgi:hypothetical protein